MKTGTFVIDPAQSDWTTIGWAELSTGFLGELVAQITIEGPDGDKHSEYWLRADPVDHRIEYLYYADTEGGIVRDGTWPIDDVAEGVWHPEDDEQMLTAFAEMARIADGPAITELVVGTEVDLLGTVDAETLTGLAPLWSAPTD